MLRKLEYLAIDNITEVEDLYLIVARMTQCAWSIAAQKKAVEKSIPFKDVEIGSPEVNEILVESFKKMPFATKLLSKFIAIDEKYKPAKQAWAGLHSQMSLVAETYKKNLVENLVIFNANLKELELKFLIPPKEEEKTLYAKANIILNKVKKISGKNPEKLSEADLEDLNSVLIYVNKTLTDRVDTEKTTSNTKELTHLAERISKKSSSKWKVLSIDLIKLAYAALIFIGILASIPTLGATLPLAFSATDELLYPEKGLAKSVSDFKSALVDTQPRSADEQQPSEQPRHK